MNREAAYRLQYDLFAYHLLCNAVKAKTHYTALGYDCFLFVETYGPYRQHVYYLAHKRLDQPTRRERGCFIKGECNDSDAECEREQSA